MHLKSDPSPLAELETPVAFVCNDAGAANIVIALLGEYMPERCTAYFEGPAAKLWGRAFPDKPLTSLMVEALEGCQCVFSGTGWASNLEHQARVYARDNHIHSIAVVDHWVNYTERFIRDGENVLPDEIWVADEYALGLVGAQIPNVKAREIRDPYRVQQAKRAGPLPEAGTGELLYLLEPARSNWGRDKLGEFQALDFFISHLDLLGLPQNVRITLRPHPSDEEGKYKQWMLQNSKLDIVIDSSDDVAGALQKASWVAGCETFALVLALESGRQVFCTLPPWAPECRLPHKGVIRLTEIV